jgi:hypothetical protein
MDYVKDEELAAAEDRGQAWLKTATRAEKATYDHGTGMLRIKLITGVLHEIPVSLIQVLCQAAPEDLADIEICGLGLNLHWPRLDADLYVPSTIMGIYGSRAWMKGIREQGKC